MRAVVSGAGRTEWTFTHRCTSRDTAAWWARRSGGAWKRPASRSLIGASSSGARPARPRGDVRVPAPSTGRRSSIDAAARVGGILANRDHPAEFLSDNLRIQVNLMDAALEVRTPRLLFLGS